MKFNSNYLIKHDDTNVLSLQIKSINDKKSDPVEFEIDTPLTFRKTTPRLLLSQIRNSSTYVDNSTLYPFRQRGVRKTANMNIFRFFGDLSHLLSILILIYNMRLRRSSAGISFKSQCLYTAVFVARYLGILISDVVLMVDLFWSWVSLYNTAMKFFFIGSSVYILYLMRGPFRPTHDPNLDTFKIEYLLIGSFVASLLFNYEFSFSEVLVFRSCIDVDSLVVQYLA
jgi:hypothetical protein